jgi:hypothetical protein
MDIDKTPVSGLSELTGGQFFVRGTLAAAHESAELGMCGVSAKARTGRAHSIRRVLPRGMLHRMTFWRTRIKRFL